MKVDNLYCSPSAKDRNSTCLSKESLKELIDCYNLSRKTKKELIKYYDNNTQLELFKKLDNKMKKLTKGSGKYWFWPDIIKKLTPNNTNITNIMRKIEKLELKPEKPNQWLKNPREWLSNYDINNVMNQYNSDRTLNYCYIGTFSIDFAIKDKNGNCLHSNFCNIDIKKDYINKNCKYIGFITNMDKHDEPGSHWTSTFIIIDHKNISYGAYYYDSVSRKTPKLINDFLVLIKTQLDKIYRNKTFNIKYNTKQHQFQNTECGMFSIIYQIRWLSKLINNKTPTFKTIIEEKLLTDNEANKARKFIFRKNIKKL